MEGPPHPTPLPLHADPAPPTPALVAVEESAECAPPQQPEQPPPTPLNENEEEEEEEEDDDDDDAVPFETDEAALAARAEAIRHYNDRRYEDALDLQYRIVRHFSRAYGATSACCGLYFLDYGLSQLRLLQSRCGVEAALQPNDEDALEACFVNLDVARVCFQKEEAQCEARGAPTLEAQLRLAEAHNAMAQLHAEREDFDGALREYESELLLYGALPPPSVPGGRRLAALYGVADCYMKEGDFEAAEERLAALLREARRQPPGTVAPAVLAELEELLEDAREMKGGRFRALQARIREQFAEGAAEAQPTAQEFYGAGDARHPFVSALPGEAEFSALSMPQSASHPVQWNEHSNSMSVSLFPPQTAGHNVEGSNNSQPIQHVVARKKPKTAQDTSAAEPQSKRLKTES